MTIELSTSSGNKNTEVYKVLKTFDFDSDRKMMSVVVQERSSGRVFVFTKGADISMMKRIKN